MTTGRKINEEINNPCRLRCPLFIGQLDISNNCARCMKNTITSLSSGIFDISEHTSLIVLGDEA